MSGGSPFISPFHSRLQIESYNYKYDDDCDQSSSLDLTRFITRDVGVEVKEKYQKFYNTVKSGIFKETATGRLVAKLIEPSQENKEIRGARVQLIREYQELQKNIKKQNISSENDQELYVNSWVSLVEYFLGPSPDQIQKELDFFKNDKFLSVLRFLPSYKELVKTFKIEKDCEQQAKYDAESLQEAGERIVSNMLNQRYSPIGLRETPSSPFLLPFKVVTPKDQVTVDLETVQQMSVNETTKHRHIEFDFQMYVTLCLNRYKIVNRINDCIQNGKAEELLKEIDDCIKFLENSSDKNRAAIDKLSAFQKEIKQITSDREDKDVIELALDIFGLAASRKKYEATQAINLFVHTSKRTTAKEMLPAAGLQSMTTRLNASQDWIQNTAEKLAISRNNDVLNLVNACAEVADKTTIFYLENFLETPRIQRIGEEDEQSMNQIKQILSMVRQYEQKGIEQPPDNEYVIDVEGYLKSDE